MYWSMMWKIFVVFFFAFLVLVSLFMFIVNFLASSPWGTRDVLLIVLISTALALICAGVGVGIVYLCHFSGLWGVFFICFGILAGLGFLYCLVWTFLPYGALMWKWFPLWLILCGGAAGVLTGIAAFVKKFVTY